MKKYITVFTLFLFLFFFLFSCTIIPDPTADAQMRFCFDGPITASLAVGDSNGNLKSDWISSSNGIPSEYTSFPPGEYNIYSLISGMIFTYEKYKFLGSFKYRIDMSIPNNTIEIFLE